MSAGRAALSLALALLVGCLDQPWVVTDLRAAADEDGGSDEDDDGSDDDASAPRKDGGSAGRCWSCGFSPATCLNGLPLSASCYECGCCAEERECERWDRERRYECERPSPEKPGRCVEKRSNGGPP